MASPVAVTIDANGISAPTFAEIQDWLKAQYRSIYGSDVYLENDSQDGQFLGVLASALNDNNAATIAAYNSFSPATAQGVPLSNVVKINGIARDVATYSTVDLRVVGVAGTVITNGVARDGNGNLWALPASVTIPPAGEITVTATCTTVGAIMAQPHAITTIQTPTLGWQSVDNASAAAAGAPVETDAALRNRQTISTAIPSRTVLDGIVGAVAAQTGVERYQAYENDTDTTDSNGIPSHSISLVVEGGDAHDIAAAIALKKTPGAGTYGTTEETVPDAYGRPMKIRFFRPTFDGIKLAITIKALSGYTTVIGDEIKQAVADYINALGIGDSVIYSRLYVPANLGGSADGMTYEITALTVGLVSGSLGTSDVVIDFNHAATCDVANIALTVV
ncbi:baseplate J/gp47 family protein [Uliginosibacterium sp. sgz301328]|uniref:baseplate J/gp47 family protein n=1 Tax=Uliginosibacterium sp. sgz301328 TaxID=3243764 RepID=UPI00359DACE3